MVPNTMCMKLSGWILTISDDVFFKNKNADGEEVAWGWDWLTLEKRGELFPWRKLRRDAKEYHLYKKTEDRRN